MSVRAPQNYKYPLIQHLYKNKANKYVYDNHGWISLLSTDTLILKKIINHIVSEESQCGFRSGHGTWHALTPSGSRKVNRNDQEFDVMFVAITKAFNAVKYEALCKFLKTLGIPDKSLNIIIFIT